ncbi:MAG: quinone oxidoreductase [Longimicrobiales bacterium]|nr:quinone oxidoreductase [Longimicrobiales bacterium]
MRGAIIVRETGGPEVLEWTELDPGSPGPDEVLVRHTAVGLNFIDVYHRTGLYPIDPPFVPGVEAAGVVEAVGREVDDLEPGDRVAYTSNGPVGSYREGRILKRRRLWTLPPEIPDDVAAAVMVKGTTVEYLVRRTYPVTEGDTVLLTAAAGGVGLIACQWLSSLGATVIGTVGSEEKAVLAREHGCDHVILYREEDIAERVARITDGRGVDVAFDSVGKSTFSASLDSLKTRGMMVSFGNASGPVDPVAPLTLTRKGSLFLTRPTVADYYRSREETEDGIGALFDMIVSGKVTPHVGARHALRDAAEAHRALENRETVGSTVLIV